MTSEELVQAFHGATEKQVSERLTSCRFFGPINPQVSTRSGAT